MNQQELIVFMVRSAWNSQVKRTDTLFDSFTYEQMLQPIAPGKNRAAYLAGHLACVNDQMLKLLGLGERNFSQLDPTFITNPDSAEVDAMSIPSIKKIWKDSNQKLSSCFDKMKSEEWFERHTAVSVEDFAREPHRNKLNVLISRTEHLAYHLGQLMLLKNKAD